MHLQPNLTAASIAGTPQATKRGGALQSGNRTLVDAQAIKNKPAGKTGTTDTVDAGDQAEDRHADGRQARDTFERSDNGQQIRLFAQDTSQTDSAGESNRVDYQA